MKISAHGLRKFVAIIFLHSIIYAYDLLFHKREP
jgi:hypothetical protein